MPFFRVVVIESGRAVKGKEVEVVGNLNPRDKKTLTFNKERIEYWLLQGAIASPTVHNLLVNAGLLKGDKLKATKNKKKVEATKKEGESVPR